MAETRPISVVVRTLQVLRALNSQPVSTLDALHRQTSIPKSSIVRLLHTLESEGLVRRAPQYGAYYLTSEVTALSSGYHSEPRIVEASSPVADRLTRELKWPVSIAVKEGDAMVIRYSTIPKSPLSFFHSTINMRISMVTQAMGRAYLAFTDPVEREALIEMLSDPLDESSQAVDSISLRTVLEEIRTQGYALRDPRVRPESSTIAVPIFEAQRVVATLGLTWFTTALSLDQAVTRFLVSLQQASTGITKSLGEIDRLRP